MWPRLAGVATTPVQGLDDVRGFFDGWARHYGDQHGRPGRRLAYRLDLLRAHARPRKDDVVLDVGCGPGDHLLALAPEIGRGLGVDLSPAMIEVAHRRAVGWPADRLEFAVDDAATLTSVAAESIDLAICIGAFEHLLDPPAALAAIRRALKPGGRFFCLTPNGDYLWYRAIAPRLRIATRHLSTDAFLTRARFTALLEQAGYADIDTGPWTFVPKGDMPRPMGWLLEGLDRLGRATGSRSLRGGLWIAARRQS